MELEGLLSNRSDVYFKLPFARSIFNGFSSEFADAVYLEHLFRWNGFSERLPRKSGPREFLTSFSKLCESVIDSNGLAADREPIKVDSDGRLAGGSHRIAAYLAGLEAVDGFNTNIPTKLGNFRAPRWDLGFFVGRRLHSEVLRNALIEQLFSPLGRSIRALVIWPRAAPHMQKIVSLIVNSGEPNPYAIRASMNPEILRKLVMQTYAGATWAANPLSVEGKMAEVGAEAWSEVVVIPLNGLAPEKVNSLKAEIREIWQNKFQGVHTTDSHGETVELLTAISGRTELQMLGAIESQRWLASVARSRSMANEAETHGLRRNLVMFSGSSVMGQLGLKEPRDVDVVALRCAGARPLDNWSDHQDYLYDFGLRGKEIAIDPTLHSWVGGIKSLNPVIYRRLINSRRENKDLPAIRLLDGFLEKCVSHQPQVSWELLSTGRSDFSRVFDLSVGPFGSSGPGDRWKSGLQSTAVSGKKSTSPSRKTRTLMWKVTGFFYRMLRLPPRALKRLVRQVLGK